MAFGERPSGSDAILKLRQWIVSELKGTGAAVTLDEFQARTPDGIVPMANIIGKFPGKAGRAIAVSGHYDTKKIAGVKFLGANDAGSSTGFLLEFARVVSHWQHNDDIYVIFFDGEEAVREWTQDDSRYGSKHLAAQWLADGTLKRLAALINIDMVGDKELDMVDDLNSTSGLRERVRAIAAKLGYSEYFRGQSGIDDDHRSFAELGVNVIDLIDLDYGPPDKTYWHTAQDTMDKLSAHSLQVVGDLTVQLIKQLDGGISN